MAALRLLLATTRPALLAQIETGSTDAEGLAARAVCQYVGSLPPALVHPRGLLERDQRMSLARLAAELRQRGTFDIIKALSKTFRLSWDAVDDERARRLFKLACYFPEATPIPPWLLGLAAGLGEGRDIVDPLGEAYRYLRDLSLLEELSGDLVRLHPLVREFGLRLVMEDDNAGKALRTEAGNRLVSELTDLNRLEERTRRMGYWHCLEQVQEAHDYVELLGAGEQVEQAEQLKRIERWLDRESYLLASEAWWPRPFPGLFYQQMFNRAVEEQSHGWPGSAGTVIPSGQSGAFAH